MQIGVAAGNVIVEEFENTDGFGVVRAGPKDSRFAALLGVAAAELLGKEVALPVKWNYHLTRQLRRFNQLEQPSSARRVHSWTSPEKKDDHVDDI